jgi:hypothetical protein
MERYLDPKNDLVFKKIFGEHKYLVKSILNALMPLGQGQRIEAVGYSQEEADAESRKYLKIHNGVFWRRSFLERKPSGD